MGDVEASAALEARLESLLLQTTLPALSLDATALRRCAIAASVYASLTCDGSDESALAPLLLGPGCDALEEYVFGETEASEESEEPVLLRFDEQPSREHFLLHCVLGNQPALFPFDAAEPLFQSCAEWVRDGVPDVHALAASFPPHTGVVVSDCSAPGQPRTRCTLSDFAQRYESASEPLLYLRDLHMVASRPGFDYQAPALFSWDWPNACHDGGLEGASDLRFVYLGRAGTCTATHCDIGNSYSWSASLCGAKKWTLYPPSATHLLMDRWGGRPPAWPLDEACSRVLWPRAHTAPCLHFTQRAGEVVFVPSGWRHNVVNLEDSLSVNANWFNAGNIHWLAHHALVEQAGEGGAAQRLAAVLSFRERELRAQSDTDRLEALLRALSLKRIEQLLPQLQNKDA